jgi:hypothetical protein
MQRIEVSDISWAFGECERAAVGSSGADPDFNCVYDHRAMPALVVSKRSALPSPAPNSLPQSAGGLHIGKQRSDGGSGVAAQVPRLSDLVILCDALQVPAKGVAGPMGHSLGQTQSQKH